MVVHTTHDQLWITYIDLMAAHTASFVQALPIDVIVYLELIDQSATACGRLRPPSLHTDTGTGTGPHNTVNGTSGSAQRGLPFLRKCCNAGLAFSYVPDDHQLDDLELVDVQDAWDTCFDLVVKGCQPPNESNYKSALLDCGNGQHLVLTNIRAPLPPRWTADSLNRLSTLERRSIIQFLYHETVHPTHLYDFLDELTPFDFVLYRDKLLFGSSSMLDQRFRERYLIRKPPRLVRYEHDQTDRGNATARRDTRFSDDHIPTRSASHLMDRSHNPYALPTVPDTTAASDDLEERSHHAAMPNDRHSQSFENNIPGFASSSPYSPPPVARSARLTHESISNFTPPDQPRTDIKVGPFGRL